MSIATQYNLVTKLTAKLMNCLAPVNRRYMVGFKNQLSQ